MQIGDLVKLSIRGAVSLCMGGYKNPDMYGTGVFLGWACHDMYGSQTIAKIHWLGGSENRQLLCSFKLGSIYRRFILLHSKRDEMPYGIVYLFPN